MYIRSEGRYERSLGAEQGTYSWLIIDVPFSDGNWQPFDNEALDPFSTAQPRSPISFDTASGKLSNQTELQAKKRREEDVIWVVC